MDLVDEDATSLDGDATQSTSRVEDDSKVGASMINVYWQDRLVPETTLSALPFFPDYKRPSMCETMGIPANWRDRLQGYLFFGWDFPHISNNKLKFQVDPNLDEWLNNKSRFRDEIETNPKHLSNTFLRSSFLTYFELLHFYPVS